MTNRELTQFRRALLHWFKENNRPLPWRESYDFYPVWISEVMLQQTQVAKVIDYYHRFLQQFPTIEKLAQADLENILRVWQGLGYYSRARNLHRAAQILVENFKGNLPPDIHDFKKLPGVGDYIATAVYSICRELPFPAIDGNVKRVFSRLFEIEIPVNTTAGEKAIRGAVEKTFDKKHPRNFNQAMMELGALICKPQNPNCDACPVQKFCGAFRNESQKNFPVKKRGKPIPEYQLAIGIVMNESKFLLAKRSPFGLLGGLWEFPGGRVDAAEEANQACQRHLREKFGLQVSVKSEIGEFKHTYSHFKIIARVFLCEPASAKLILRDHDDYVWAGLRDYHSLPIHSAHLKIIDMLKKRKK